VTVVTPAPGGGTSGSLGFTVSPAATAPLSPPTGLSVTPLTADATGATFAIAWNAVAGAASYRYIAAFNDGSAPQQGAVSLTSFQLRMPYHASGAAFGAFVCLRSADAAGQQSTTHACAAVPVPARPATPPVPVAGSLSPASATAGGAGFTLTVNGSGFVTSSVVRWNGSPRPTTFVGATQLRAAIAAADIASPGSVPVTVVTPSPGGGTSGALAFTVSPPPAPVPVASSLSPASATAGGSGFTLTVNGSGFVASSVVRWNGNPRPTTFVSATQLRAAIGEAGIASPRSVPVSVFTPAPGGGTSGALSFTVSPPPPVPVASGLSPASATVGGPGFTLTVHGSGFVATSVVRWNGNPRPTTFVSATQLRATIGAPDLAGAGSVGVRVFTPSPGGGTSGALTFTVSPAPTAPPGPPTGLSVKQLTAGEGGVTFAIAWNAVAGAASYRYIAAFNDGSAPQQGAVTGLTSFQLRMPYHASGAAFGAFVCLRSVDAAGQQSTTHSCAPVPVPAR
jgi:hypothetical protein